MKCIKEKAILFFWLLIFFIFCLGVFNYQGSKFIYFIFTLISSLLLYIGFFKTPIFFETFIAIFFWLGFWLKFTLRIISFNGAFDLGGATNFDSSLIASSVGLSAFIFAGFLRRKISLKVIGTPFFNMSDLDSFYKKHRLVILTTFSFMIIFIASTNYFYGVYQRGEVSVEGIPFVIRGLYVWLLTFGFLSFSALFLFFELKSSISKFFTVLILGLLGSFLSSVSMLSRAMVLGVGSLFLGSYRQFLDFKIKVSYPKKMHMLAVFLIMIAVIISSAIVVNKFRHYSYEGVYEFNPVSETRSLFVDRWVGIEGVISVNSSPKKGWELFTDALGEKYRDNGTSFYDENVIDSPYAKLDLSKHHFMNLPGVIGFFFYTGSHLFLFAMIFLIAMSASFLEISIYKLLGGNLIICAVFSQVIASRLSNFGYVPAQSYLLLGTIFINVLIIFYLNRFLHILGKIK